MKKLTALFTLITTLFSSEMCAGPTPEETNELQLLVTQGHEVVNVPEAPDENTQQDIDSRLCSRLESMGTIPKVVMVNGMSIISSSGAGILISGGVLYLGVPLAIASVGCQLLPYGGLNYAISCVLGCIKNN